MGLEAETELSLNAQVLHVKALLESRELIFRGALKKTIAIRDLIDPHVVDDRLLFMHAGESYALALPAGQAAKWLKKLTTEPPSLAQKLGIDAAHPAYIRGEVADEALKDALVDAVTIDPHAAALGIAVASTPDGLTAALADLMNILPEAPLWVVFPKGAKSPLPESAVRTHMRALNFVDTKACAVSDSLTAIRFNRRKPMSPDAHKNT